MSVVTPRRQGTTAVRQSRKYFISSLETRSIPSRRRSDQSNNPQPARGMRGSPPRGMRLSQSCELSTTQQTSHRMSERFTETQMLKLAEIYRDCDCLWNGNSELYKSRSARNAAYQTILERLNIPGLTVKDIPKKIKNLRSSYYQEIKRIQNSKRSGARTGEDTVYRPKVSWFKTVEGFLKPFTNKRELYSYDDKDSNSASDCELEAGNTKQLEEELLEEDSIITDDHGEVEWDLANHATIAVPREQSETSVNSYLIVPPNKLAKKRNIDKKDEDIQNAIERIDQIANSLTQSASSLIERREDEFDTFGKYIAMSLRSLPKEMAIVGQTEIQKVISEIQLKALRKNSEPILLSYGDSIVKLEYP